MVEITSSSVRMYSRPGAPLTYFNDVGGGGGAKDFFGSDILAKRDFLGLWKTMAFFGSRKQHRDFLGYCIFHQLKSTITCLCGITGYF